MGHQVFKFGGASVKSAEAVRNVAKLIQLHKDQPLLVVVSAMGKTTNLLESLVEKFLGEESYEGELIQLKEFHRRIIEELIGAEKETFFEVENLFIELECLLDLDLKDKGYDYAYDQIICFGELISTRIISRFLHQEKVANRWLDARSFIVTTDKHRSARVLWEKTLARIQRRMRPLVAKQVVITQGFISRSESNHNTTLGREGSDYSAAIFARGLEADRLIIWKDVPGVMNADPKRVDTAELLPNISYREAIELAYYGASVIHPKTLQPLQRANIPLHVKSFLNHELPGTSVQDFGKQPQVHVPCYIYKSDQTLIHISTTDLAFIVEDNLSYIFQKLSETGLTVNLMQNTAVSFSICVNSDLRRVNLLKDELTPEYDLQILTDLEMLTVFNPAEEGNYSELHLGKKVVLENSTANAVQLILRS
jgi:aspartate kinase